MISVSLQKWRKLSHPQTSPTSGKELKPWFEAYLEPGTLILTDGWKAYNFLEKDFEHHAQKSPGGWKSAKVPALRWVNTVLGNLKGNIKGVTRWVNRGHLDRSLAEFCIGC